MGGIYLIKSLGIGFLYIFGNEVRKFQFIILKKAWCLMNKRKSFGIILNTLISFRHMVEIRACLNIYFVSIDILIEVLHDVGIVISLI